MVESQEGWWRQHGLTVVVLLTAFALAIIVRSIWAYSIFHQWGWLYVYGGGSDSYYHARVMSWIAENHTNLIRDPLLKYPLSPINPREPLFDWMNGVLGILFQGFFTPTLGQPASVVAGSFFLDIQSPFWAAMGVFPVYLIGKEVSSRRMGLLAAITFPFVVASIESSALGYANYLTFYAFVMLVTVYAYLRLVKAAGHRRWVASYRRPREIPAAIRAMLRYERSGFKWAVFTGVCLGALALSWQGYPFFIAALVGFLVVQMIVERIRRVDSFSLYVLTWVVGLVGFPMAMPYFFVQGGNSLNGFFLSWFEIPLLVFFGSLVVLLPFLLLRDYPWVVSIPAFVLTAAAAVGILFVASPHSFSTIITGQGYFVKTLVYSTVAEAQAPSIDSLILGFGVLTFFIAFVGLGLYAYKLGRQKFRREHTMFFVFALISVYLPITAAKFFLLGSAVFILLAAEVLVMILDIAGYGQLRRNVASLSDRRSQFTAFRRSLKARHFLVMGLLLLILIPNVWYAIDAGVPYNLKSGYNTQIYDTLPAPIRTSAANASTFYLGAAGTSLDTPDQYDSASYNWLASQDTNLPEPQRPAFISWWDYGFQTVGQGQHPTVADNFQNGIVPAGAFLLSQNESQAISVLAIQLLYANQITSGQRYFTSGINRILVANGVNATEVHNLMVNTSQDVPLVIAHPERYLPVDPAHLDPLNAMFMATSWYLADTVPLSGVANLYDDLQAYTGWSIRYAMVDTRLFPVSGSNTGIFYAPADLTDRVIGPGGTPSAFFNVTVLGSDGNTYPAGQVPPTVSAVSYNINRFAPFYNSMIYRVFAGYNGSDIGQSGGIPGLEGAIGSGYYPEPGWMLQHFRAVYITAFYCPHGSTGGNGCVAMNQPEAIALAKATNGTAETVTNGAAGSYYTNGNSILAYYAGQPLLGSVTLPDGAPVAGARVTVYDAFNIPHETTVTAKDGSFSLTLPPGNITVNVTSGSFNGLIQAGSTTLSTTHLYVAPALGYAFDAPPLVRSFTLAPAKISGTLYWNNANNTTYQPPSDTIIPGATVNLWGGGGLPAFHTRTDASGTYLLSNLPPGSYNLSVTYQGSNFTQSPQSFATGDAKNLSIGLTPGQLRGHLLSTVPGGSTGATVTLSQQGGTTATLVTGPNGAFTASSLAPGNYTIRATNPSHDLASVPQSFLIGTNGTHVALNLTLEPMVTVSLVVLSAGSPVANFPVRFTPIVATSALPANQSNASASPPTVNSTTLYSGPGGQIVATLPTGNYSIYAVGYQGGRAYAGFGTAYLSGLTGTIPLEPIALAPAFAVHGFSGPPASGVAPTSIVITANTARGDTISASANLSGDWLLLLPAGTYGLSATAPPSGGTGIGYAALASLAVAGTTFVNLSLSPAMVVHASLGVFERGQLIYPASGALVNVTEEPSGALLTSVADSAGNATFAVPATVSAGASYCVGVTSFGFDPYLACGLDPAAIARLSTIPLDLSTVQLTLSVSGFPTGALIHVNVTAARPPAQTITLAGGSTFSTPIVPGSYTVTAYATTVNGGLYRPPAPLNVTFPPGVYQENLSIVLFHQVASRGVLELPAGVPATSVSLRLTAPGYDQNLTGQQFVTSFLAAPGSYTVFAAASAGNITFANLTHVTVGSTGGVYPALDLSQPGGLLRGNFSVPNGGAVNGTVPVQLTTPGGYTLDTVAIAGSFTALLPEGMTVYPSMTTTVPSVVPGGVTRYTVYTVVPGSSCTQQPNLTICRVPLAAKVLRSTVVGTLTFGAQTTFLPGTIDLIGPYPSANLTTATAVAGGSFSASLVPGLYDLYATSGSGGSRLATVEQVPIGYGDPVDLNLTLGPAWIDTLTLQSTSSGASPVAQVNWTGPDGVGFSLSGLPVNTPTDYALPVGVWIITASSSAAPYGVATPTNGSGTAALMSGNAATRVTLVPVLTPRVGISVQGPDSATIGPGGLASFSLAIANTGSSPVAFHLVGSPSTWTFNFTPENLSLGVVAGNSSAHAEVVIHVPAGTAVAHPPIAIEAVGPGGVLLGVASPAPALVLLPVQGLAIGASPTLGAVSPNSATLPFWVVNSGNAPEGVRLTITDTQRLASLGWTAVVAKGTTPLPGSTTISAGSNNSFSVLLTSPTNSPVPPGSVTVVATLQNGTLESVSTTLTVSELPVSITNGTLTITGPSVGTPPAYPTWVPVALAFVPAAAVAVFAVTYRWWRSRRWTRR